MSKYRIAATVFCLICSAFPVFAQSGYQGKEFWLVFPQNSLPVSELGQRLIISGDYGTNVLIKLVATGEEIPVRLSQTDRVQIVPIDTAYYVTSEGLHSATIHITADRDISVTALSYRDGSSDTYQILPVNRLGTEYAVIGYSPFYEIYSTQFDIVATEDSTSISISIPKRQKFSISLNKGQAFHSGGANKDTLPDLTGTMVTSSKPVGVFTGHSCAQVPASRYYCNTLIEMLPPASALGTEYAIPHLNNPYTIRVVALNDNTDIAINGTKQAILDRGEFFEQNGLSTNIILSASHKVCVMQYSEGCGGQTNVSDPFMMVIAPTTASLNEVEFMTPFKGSWLHFINVVTTSEGVDGLMLNTAHLPKKYFKQINDTDLFAAQIEVGFGFHTVTSDTPFIAYVYGYGVADDAFNAYGHLCGMK